MLSCAIDAFRGETIERGELSEERRGFGQVFSKERTTDKNVESDSPLETFCAWTARGNNLL